MKKNIIFATNAQKVLRYFMQYVHDELMEKEVRQATKISKSGINYALRELTQYAFLSRMKKGKTFLYKLNHSHTIVRQLKVIDTLSEIEGIVKKIKKMSSRIILFGSTSRGENTINSDIDLLVISRNKEAILKEIEKYKGKKQIQAVVWTEVGFLDKKKRDVVFYEQVNKGIVLWAGNRDEF